MHVIMCQTLLRYGFRKDVIEWCKYYLGNRQQRVNIYSSLSANESVSSGVSQGSILCPLFFIIYLNDLLKLFPDDGIHILVYVDDTVVYCLETISKLCTLNKLTTNVTKTKHMLHNPLSCKINHFEPSFYMDGKHLENVSHLLWCYYR